MSSPIMHKIVENYILYEPIGAGQYGKVYRAKNTNTNETVAVKVIPLQKFAQVPKLHEFTANEIKMLGRINNANVVHFIEMMKTVNNMYLVYEFCEGGTLEDIIQKKRFLPEQEALKIFLQLLNAFKAIYKENILHRDLKPSNILVHDGIFKIADFGFCKKMSGPQELTFTMVGSPIYMAPEILKGYPYNVKGDIWSLGVVLYEMLFGVCPFEDKTLAGLIYQIDKKPLGFPKEINQISQSTERLLRRMLVLEHRNRIDWNELLEYKINIPEPTKIPVVLKNLDMNANKHATSCPSSATTLRKCESEKSDNATRRKIEGANDNLDSKENENIPDKVKKESSKGSTDINYGSNGSTGSTGSTETNKTAEKVLPKVEEFEDAISYEQNIQKKSDVIMKALVKDRNKAMFLVRVVKATLEHDIGNKVAAVVYLLLKKAYITVEALKKDISIENPKSKFKSLESWDDFQNKDEFLAFSNFLNEEIEEIIIYTALVKREIETMIPEGARKFAADKEDILRDPIFEMELLSNGSMNERFFNQTVISYTQELRSKVTNNIDTISEKDFELLRYINEVLDCSNMEDLFDKTLLDSVVKLEEQQYFKYLKTCGRDKLQRMIDEKIEIIKAKVV